MRSLRLAAVAGLVLAGAAGAGRIRAQPPIPFFTIWRRASVADPWRYIAE